MDCQKVEDQNIIERYLTERLSEPETEAFEQHYLECKKCFGELQMRHAVAIELSHRPIPVTPARSPWMPLSWQWGLASAAVALAVLSGALYMRSRVETPAPATQTPTVQQPNPAVLEQLASVDQIPPYLPGLIRGGSTNPALIKFQEGMSFYSSQKYSEAIAPLSEASRLDPQHVPTAFYLGISQLVSGNPDDAITQLAKITSQPEYAEEAHWFLAKAYLKKKDFRSARTELQAVQSLHGEHATAAQDLLNRIQNF
jgi:tetratricopeptide (TPR) repeat protein